MRQFLQELGTDALRNELHPNTWVNALMSDYTPVSSVGTDDLPRSISHDIYPNWIITDTRFPNEAEAIKKAGGIIIRVDRPGVGPLNDHPSEVSLDNWQFDHKIANVSDVEALALSVKSILQKENLIE